MSVPEDQVEVETTPARKPRRRLPMKVLYRGLELSDDSEQLLDEAMVQGDFTDPDEAVKEALRVFLNSLKA